MAYIYKPRAGSNQNIVNGHLEKRFFPVFGLWATDFLAFSQEKEGVLASAGRTADFKILSRQSGRTNKPEYIVEIVSLVSRSASLRGRRRLPRVVVYGQHASRK